MTPYYSDSLVTIYHGDCRDVLPDLPDASADLLFTDPPYGMQFVSGQRQATPLGNVKADGARQGMRLMRQALHAGASVMRPDAHYLVFCHWESWPDFYDACASYFPVRNALVWWKNRGGMGDTEMEYARDYEVILYGATGRRPVVGKRLGAVLHGFPPAANDRLHPTEKPHALLEHLIGRHAPPDGTVLDCFAGSGSALRAAKSLGRRAIGIEIEERYCEIAAERCRQEVLDLGGAA